MNSSSGERKRNLTTNVFILLVGTTFAQILGIIVSPILTRLYGPETFGLYAIFFSLTSIISVVVCLRYECAIVLPESDHDAANVLALCFLLILIITLCTIPFILFENTYITQLLNAPDLGKFIWLLPLSILFLGITLALNYWNTRTKKFKRLAANRILNSTTTSGTQLGAGFSGYNTAEGLIYGGIFGQFISSFFLAISIFREDYIFIRKSITRQGISDSLKRYRDFALFDSWAELLNTMSWQLPVFLFAIYFSPVIVGFYSLGLRILQTPMSLIGGSLSQVFYPRAVEAKMEGNTLNILVKNFFEVLVVVGLFPCLLLTLIGGDLFSVVFGEQWREAGVFAQILGIWAFFWFISSPLSTLYYVFEKQKDFSYFTIVNLVTRFGSLMIGGILGSVYIALGLFAVSGIFIYGYLCFVVMKYSGMSWAVVKNILISNFTIFVPFGIIIVILKILNFSSIIIVVTSFVMAIIYYFYIIRKNSQIREIVGRIRILKILID